MADRFGPYDVHECVGSGGMATVHRATIELGGGLQREVALKRLLPHLAEDDRFVEDFVREAKLASHLRHPNIIQIYELGRYGGVYFIAMELVRGVSLMTLMRIASRQHKRVPVNAVVSLMLELTDALDHAHTIVNDRGELLGLVHRDLTPSNLLVTDDGHVKIIDFGIAKAMRGDLSTDSGLAKGKLGYMAIEAMRAEPIDGRADLFSAGVVMWELLTGRRLYKSTNEWGQPVRDKEVRLPSSLNPECPPELDPIVLRAVAQEPEDRWPTADAMHRALALTSRGLVATPAEVVRAKQSLRPETSADPYAGFSIEIEIDDYDDDDDGAPRVAQRPPTRRLDASEPLGESMGRWWPAEPATEPKLRVEGSSPWPIEPPTEERQYSVDMLRAAAGENTNEEAAAFGRDVSVRDVVRELPVTFSPTDFGTDPGETAPSAPRFDLSETRKLRAPPSPEPPTEPRKPKPKKPRAATRALSSPDKPKPAVPPPFRPKRSTLRKPAPGPTVDRVTPPAGTPIADQTERDDTKSFSGEPDTVEARRFDDDE